MKLTHLGANMTELNMGKFTVFYSYNTPVAYMDNTNGKRYRTDKFWSKTTTRHLNFWLDRGYYETKTQAEIDNLFVGCSDDVQEREVA